MLNCAAEENKKNGWDMRIHVDGASGAMIAPFIYPGVHLASALGIVADPKRRSTHEDLLNWSVCAGCWLVSFCPAAKSFFLTSARRASSLAQPDASKTTLLSV